MSGQVSVSARLLAPGHTAMLLQRTWLTAYGLNPSRLLSYGGNGKGRPVTISLFVKCKNDSIEEFNELRQRLVAAFSGVFAIACAKPCSDDATSVETISYRAHHLDVTTFINVSSLYDVETVTFIEFNHSVNHK